MKKANAKVIFAHDFLSQKEADAYINEAEVEKIILLSPYCSANREQMPERIHNYITEQYSKASVQGEKTIDWKEFIALG